MVARRADGRVRLVLVRHGESEWNRAGRWQGHGGRGLTDLGRAQAAVTAARLLGEQPHPDLVIHSDLERAAQTAAPFVERLAAPVVVDPRLRERDVGWWSGLTRAEIASADPEGLAAWEAGRDVPAGGGETLGQMRARALAALDDVTGRLAGAGGGLAVVVTHGGPIRGAVAGLLGLPVGAARRLSSPGNCSITVVDRDARQARLVVYADADHLADSEPARP